MRSPGAASTTYGSLVLPGHRLPPGSVPPTASTPAQEAGSSGPAKRLALPALATRTTSCPSAYATAACSAGSQRAGEAWPMPKGMSMTRAPCVTEYLIPAAAVATDRGPEPPTMTGRILARGAMPTVPVPVPWPAIITAIAVPCPSSPAWMSVSPLRAVPVRSAPGSTTPRRSGRLAWTPLSTSATVTPAPWASGHTVRWTCQAASHHSPGPGASRARVPAGARCPAAKGPAGRVPAGRVPAGRVPAGRGPAGRVPLARAAPAARGRAQAASRPTARADNGRHTSVERMGGWSRLTVGRRVRNR